MLRKITSKIGGSVKQNVIIYYVSLSLNVKICNLSPSRRERSGDILESCTVLYVRMWVAQ